MTGRGLVDAAAPQARRAWRIAGRVLNVLPRPLDFLPWIKLKLGLVVVGSGVAGLIVFYLGIGRVPPITSATAIAVALVTSQVFAHGMTGPLREMTAASRAMARGDYTSHVTATSRDEVGQLASAFNQMAADLAAADRQRRELIANVSHELRTPIFALQAVLENAVDGVAVPDTEMLTAALAQTERLGRLVTELLDVSRLDAGVAPINPEEFPVDAFLASAVREAEVTAQSAGRDVKFAVSAPAAVFSADPHRLRQVLANLLDNATRHSPPGGRIQVTAQVDGDTLVVEVDDEGPGIPAEQRNRVFERFTRGAGDRTGQHGGHDAERSGSGGTGLGLAIARWVVELHGGTIAVVDGAPGCRIRFTIARS